MDYDLSPPQRLLQQAARSFVARECPLTRVRELIDGGTAFDADLWHSIADQGWIGLHLPEQLGGLDLTVIELAVVAEQLGQGCLPGPCLSANWAVTEISKSANATDIGIIDDRQARRCAIKKAKMAPTTAANARYSSTPMSLADIG